MPGPCSAPNGDRSLFDYTPIWCEKHKFNLAKCVMTCEQLSKRAMLAKQGKLITGKTR